MPDRVAELLLEAAAASGVLQTFVLFYELKALADGHEFTTLELIVHARTPANERLRTAIAAVCGGEIDARRLAKVLSEWRGKHVGFGYTVAQIGADRGWLLWKFEPFDPSLAPTGW